MFRNFSLAGVIAHLVTSLFAGFICYLVCSLFSFSFNPSEWNGVSIVCEWIGIIWVGWYFISTLISPPPAYIKQGIPRKDAEMIVKYYGTYAAELSKMQKFTILAQYAKYRELMENYNFDDRIIVQIETLVAKGLGVRYGRANYFENIDRAETAHQIEFLKGQRYLTDVMIVHFHIMTLAANGQGLPSEMKDLMYQAEAQELCRRQYTEFGYTDEEAQAVVRKATGQ
ncbi:MAG: hypothetical protein MJZ32_05225 [Bacteroidaceae bacterium]|nr:hypothetical protein [Bacteroidaceae bacterium]